MGGEAGGGRGGMIRDDEWMNDGLHVLSSRTYVTSGGGI